MMDMMDLPDLSLAWIISMSATVLLLTYFWFSRRNPKYPPCPLRPWPIVGNLLQLNPDPREQFADFRKQCGDIYSLYMGPKHFVLLNGLEVVKEALVKQGDDFSDRAANVYAISSHGVNKGIISSNGPNWKEQRAFSVSTLRNFGLGSNILAVKVQDEVACFIELLEGFKGKPTDICTFLDVSVSNIICSIVAGQRYEYDDREFQRLQEIMDFNLKQSQGTAILNFYPWLKFLPGDLFGYKIMEKNYREFYDIFARVHLKENEDVVGEPGNFIAAYLQEMTRKEKAGETTYLDRANLLKLILDLFLTGTDTVAKTLLWFFLYMVNYPNVQERLFQEIKDVVGLVRIPVVQDRSKLIYMMATIMEVQRLASLVPLGVPRLLPRDVKLRGYKLPKGAEVMVNYDSILHDPTLWGADTDTFRPERFINKDGSLLAPEAWIPFSFGRRVCLGESLTNMELFLYIANILQRFQLSPADPTVNPPIKGHFGLTHGPLRYDIAILSRT